MKNIAIIIPSLQFWWGAEKVASILGTKLHEEWYHIFYLTFYDSKEKYPFKWNYHTLNEAQTSSFFSKMNKLFTRTLKVKNFCKKYKIDSIISLMEDANIPTIISRFLGNNSKIIVSIHHSIAAYGKGIYHLCIRYLYRFADNITVLTHYEKEQLTQKFKIPIQKVNIIPNGLNLDEIKEKQKAELPTQYRPLFKDKKFTFISVGRLNPIKNQSLMIESFLSMNKKYPDTQLIILGEGELRYQLEKQIWNNPDIHLLGNQQNIFPFLMKSDCFLLSSISEALPTVLLEALACGLPIVSSETQWWKEIIFNNLYGIIFENNNRKELLRYMNEIYTDNWLRKKYQNKSLERSKEFEINNLIKKRKRIL